MNDRTLAFTPAWKQHDMIRAREVSPVELVELYLRRIDSLNPQLNAYLTVVGDMAIGWAKEAEAAVMRGDDLAPLHGVPISIKDLNATKGIRTTNGSLIFKDDVPDADDIVSERIRASGAILLGKTNTPEMGHKGSTENRLGPPCRNPWDLTRTPGGSSGGAAAGQVAGLSALSQGSDGGGSIRIPASYCGLYGIKGTQGRVPSISTAPGGWGQLGQNGPITTTVKDSAILLQALSGPDDRDPVCVRTPAPDFSAGLSKGVKGLRIGWTPDFGSAPVDPEVRAACEAAARSFEALGAHVEDAGINIDYEEAFDTMDTIMFSDRAANNGVHLEQNADLLDDTLRPLLEEAMTWSARKMAFALRSFEWHRFNFARIFDTYDLLLSPVMATPAFTIGEPPQVIDGQRVMSEFWGFNPFNFLINMSGQTAASIPCGFSGDGLPIGLHMIGAKGQEALVLQASAAYEEAHPWAGKHPPVS